MASDVSLTSEVKDNEKKKQLKIDLFICIQNLKKLFLHHPRLEKPCHRRDPILKNCNNFFVWMNIELWIYHSHNIFFSIVVFDSLCSNLFCEQLLYLQFFKQFGFLSIIIPISNFPNFFILFQKDLFSCLYTFFTKNEIFPVFFLMLFDLIVWCKNEYLIISTVNLYFKQNYSFVNISKFKTWNKDAKLNVCY